MCTPVVFRAVCEMHLLVWEHDIALSFAWQPRSSVNMRKSDALSNPTDHGHCLCSCKIARGQICVLHGEQPELDCFASASAHMQAFLCAALRRRVRGCGRPAPELVDAAARRASAAWQATCRASRCAGS